MFTRVCLKAVQEKKSPTTLINITVQNNLDQIISIKTMKMTRRWKDSQWDNPCIRCLKAQVKSLF